MSDIERARRAWKIFHQKENPRKEIKLRGKASEWPTDWGHVGHAVTVYYLSDKWYEDGNEVAYYHDHGKGKIDCWLANEEGKFAKSPPLGQLSESAAVLGYCLGFDIRPTGWKRIYEVEVDEGDLLCCLPDRKTLVVVDPKHGPYALFAGPGLHVGARGIVG